MKVELRVGVDPGGKLLWRELGEKLLELVLVPSINIRPALLSLDGVEYGLEVSLVISVKDLLSGVAVVVVSSWHQ